MRETIIILSVIALIGVGGYFALKVEKPKITPPTNTISDISKKSPQLDQEIKKPVEKKLTITENTGTDKNKEEKAIIKNPMQAVIETNKGKVTIKLYKDLAPNTVANFAKLAQEGFYDGTKFHRIIKGFMIQGGDPLTKDESKQNMWGTGDPGYKFKDEIHTENNNNIGTIAMANSGPNTNGSQFFINSSDNNFLDSKHTVFGIVTKGTEVVAEIENTQTGAQDRPTEPITIISVEIK